MRRSFCLGMNVLPLVIAVLVLAVAGLLFTTARLQHHTAGAALLAAPAALAFGLESQRGHPAGTGDASSAAAFAE